MLAFFAFFVVAFFVFFCAFFYYFCSFFFLLFFACFFFFFGRLLQGTVVLFSPWLFGAWNLSSHAVEYQRQGSFWAQVVNVLLSGGVIRIARCIDCICVSHLLLAINQSKWPWREGCTIDTHIVNGRSRVTGPYRPTHPYNVGTEHVGFISSTRQTWLRTTRVRRVA